MLLFLSGALIGTVMGLTGSGGSLIAIPLFLHVVGMPFSEASILSLPTVMIASLFNLLPSWNHVRWKIILLVLPFSIFGSCAVLPLKNAIPEIMIRFFIVLIAATGLYSLWRPEKEVRSGKMSTLAGVLSGLLTGILTTLTGLGGGVILVPLLRAFLSLDLKAAIPTSLVLIFVTAAVSFFLQAKGLAFETQSLIFLSAGIFTAVLGLRFGMKSIPDVSRKIAFSLVVIFTVGGLIF